MREAKYPVCMLVWDENTRAKKKKKKKNREEM